VKSDSTIRIVSLALSLISLVAVFYIDVEIATTYQHSDGKTKALFGIIEISRFSYKYLVVIPALLSIVLITIVIWKRKFSFLDMAILAIGLIAIIGTITSSWKLIISPGTLNHFEIESCAVA
jgi:hypothetical protein